MLSIVHTGQIRETMRKTTYKAMESALKDALHDLEILAGNKVGPSDVSWQDVAGTASVNLKVLASLLDQARLGNAEPFLTFPAPSECMEESEV